MGVSTPWSPVRAGFWQFRTVQTPDSPVRRTRPYFFLRMLSAFSLTVYVCKKKRTKDNTHWSRVCSCRRVCSCTFDSPVPCRLLTALCAERVHTSSIVVCIFSYSVCLQKKTRTKDNTYWSRVCACIHSCTHACIRDVNAYVCAVMRAWAPTHRIEDLEVALRLLARADRDRLERPAHSLAFPTLWLRGAHLIEPKVRPRPKDEKQGYGKRREWERGRCAELGMLYEVWRTEYGVLCILYWVCWAGYAVLGMLCWV